MPVAEADRLHYKWRRHTHDRRADVGRLILTDCRGSVDGRRQIAESFQHVPGETIELDVVRVGGCVHLGRRASRPPELAAIVREVGGHMSAFSKKDIAITGGSSGLGLALASALLEREARVTLIARDPTRLAAAQARLLESSPDASIDTLAIDITDRVQTNDAFAAIAGLDILINSAGILNEGRFDLQPEDEFEAVIKTNLLGTVNATRAALPLLKTSAGRLVNIASLAGLMGVYGYTAYSASKHALVGFTESLRFELEQDEVTVHLVCPSEFDSPMVDALDRTRSAENRAHVLTLPKVQVEKIVAGTLRGIERDKYFIVPGTRAHAASIGGRLAPGITRRVGDRVVAKARRK